MDDYQLDTSDNVVADLLSQFNYHNGSETLQVPEAQPEQQPQHSHELPQESYTADQIQQAAQLAAAAEAQPLPELKFVGVEVPAPVNSGEYEYLPGHFEVRHVIREEWDVDEDESSYVVKLRSGEVQRVSSGLLWLNFRINNANVFYFIFQVSFIHLQTLKNGPAALELFKTSGQNGMRDSSRSLSRITSESPGEDEYDLISSLSDGKRRSKRTTRARRFTEYFDGGSSDDKVTRPVSVSSEDVITSSAATSRARRPRRGVRQRGSRQSTLRSFKLSDSDDEPKRKGTRFSTRERRTARRNLRERFEDEISENEVPKEKKFFGAKEVFHAIPSNDPFRLRHLNACDVCGISGNDEVKGPLVFCQGCTDAYHQVCLGPRATREHLVTKVGDDQFVLQCRRCIGVAHAKDRLCPHQGSCTVCTNKGSRSKPLRKRLTPKVEQQLRHDNDGKDPITPTDMTQVNNVRNVLFRCTGCHRGYHLEHLPPLSDIADDDDDDISSSRFEQYSSKWQCLDCLSAPGEIGAMVAWRPADSQISGYAASNVAEEKKEYLLKWRGKSYHHITWMPGAWVWGVVNPAMRRAFLKSDKDTAPKTTAEEAIPEDYLLVDIVFDVKFSENPRERTEEADLARIDKVMEAYVKFTGLQYEEAVWEAPPEPGSERWEYFKSAYEDWVKRDHIHTPNQHALKKHLAHVREQNFKSTVVRDTQPESMTGDVMEFQKDGLNWLYYMWFKQQNAILADEMGLGKTIQVIGFFATLIQYHKCWPFLVVVPNSTCPNWRKEIKKWVPSIRVVTYYGSAFSRKLAHDHEMFGKDDSDLRCHVVITSYEAMTDDTSRRVLARIPWAGLVVDEGQRLKNDKSQLYEGLSRIKFPFKILLTGTPLQNNTRELFNLLQFCDPSIDAEELESEYGVLSKDNIPKLHEMIRPFFLRRTKAQVLHFLPPIANIIVPLSMSVVQKKLYKSILAKNPQLIQAIFQRTGDKGGMKQAERKNLNNILLQLRKCLCHPFLYSKAIEERTADSTASQRNLIEAAGKLRLLQIMLPKLQQRGHRVLIFSQFLENLDIVEDFLDGLGILHRRLDGRMTSLEKQKQIEQYNAEGSPYFAFLLSTRSGGVGINLATADTVIIMDPDFNPHQDMQASSRAHRIGQKNKVLVFQLMTRGSAEEKIMQIGKKKMVLDHVLIDRMVAEEDDGRDLESILRHGAQELFEDDDSGDIHYDSESVDKLLDRSQAEQLRTPDDKGTEDPFSYARVWTNDNQNLDGQLGDATEEASINPSVWDNILKEREQAAAEEAKGKAEALGRGKRKRTAVDYSHAADVSPAKPGREGDSDVEFKGAPEAESGSSDSDPGMASDDMETRRPAKKPKGRHR